MQRREFIRNAALLSGAGMLLQQRSLAAFFHTDAFNIRMLRNGVGIFTERGGTMGFFFSKSGILTIDSQFPDTAPHYMEEVKKLSDTPFNYLLNTHHHGDHTGGNIAFKGLVKHVAAHENCLVNLKAVAEKQKTMDKQLLPDLTFTREMKIKLGKEKVRGHYYGAAHTNGDVLWHFQEANIVHMGDLMFNRRHPFVDRSAGASIQNWIQVLERAEKKFNKDTLFIFGHAAEGREVTGNRADLLAFRDYLQRLLDFTRTEIKAGKTREEFIKNTSIPGENEWKGAGIERPLTAAYEELAGVR